MNGNDGGTMFDSLGSFIRNWTPFIMLVVSGLVWGMKLEGRYDYLEARQEQMRVNLARLEARIEPGILPIASEKIFSLQEHQHALESRMTKLEDRVDRLHPPK